MPDEDNHLPTLLRLKRYEQPGPDYFDDFLVEFRRRQRAELLKRPLWRIALDRAEGFFGTPSFAPIGHLQYATAVVVVVSGLVLFNFRTGERGAANIAQRSPVPTSQLFSQRTLPAALDPRDDQFDVSTESMSHRSQPATSPRYIIDARPASYEPTFNF